MTRVTRDQQLLAECVAQARPGGIGQIAPYTGTNLQAVRARASALGTGARAPNEGGRYCQRAHKNPASWTPRARTECTRATGRMKLAGKGGTHRPALSA